MTNKVFRIVLLFFLSAILFECSFDDKTGICSDKKKWKIANVVLIKVSNEKSNFQKELNPEL